MSSAKRNTRPNARGNISPQPTRVPPPARRPSRAIPAQPATSSQPAHPYSAELKLVFDRMIRENQDGFYQSLVYTLNNNGTFLNRGDLNMYYLSPENDLRFSETEMRNYQEYQADEVDEDAKEEEEEHVAPLAYVDVRPEPELLHELHSNLAAVQFTVNPVRMHMSRAEVAEAMPQLVAGYTQLRTDRVHNIDRDNIPVYAAKMINTYNWYILYLGVLHSGVSQLQIMREMFGGMHHPFRDYLVSVKTLFVLINHCGFGLLVRPGWFSFIKLMSRRFSRAARENLLQQHEITVLDRGLRRRGIFAVEYNTLDDNSERLAL